jgi:hypothetical protein
MTDGAGGGAARHPRITPAISSLRTGRGYHGSGGALPCRSRSIPRHARQPALEVEPKGTLEHP